MPPLYFNYQLHTYTGTLLISPHFWGTRENACSTRMVRWSFSDDCPLIIEWSSPMSAKKYFTSAVMMNKLNLRHVLQKIFYLFTSHACQVLFCTH